MAYQPKSYRKFIATAATATMVAGAVAPLASFAASDATGIYKDAVNYLIEKGIASGLNKDTFGVQEKIKRGDAAIMVANALGVYGKDAKDAGFKDINSRVAKAVNPLKEAGIISGKTATEFKPDANITRGEMAIIVAKAYKIQAVASKEVPFKDATGIYKDAVAALYTNDIASGATADAFGTTADITRGQFAIFLYKAENMIDQTAPVITLKGDKDVSVEYGADYADAGATAVDNKDGNVEVKTEVKDAAGNVVAAVDTKVVGKYTVTYSAVDKAGNKSEAVRTVTVKAAQELKIQSVSALNSKQATVTFTSAVPEGADFTNFDINGGLTVSDVKFSSDRKSATVTVSSDFTRDQEYSISVFGVKDAAGKEYAETKGSFTWKVADGVTVALGSTSLEQGQTVGLTVKDQAGKDVKDAKVEVTSYNTNLVTVTNPDKDPATVKVTANSDKLAGSTDVVVETTLPDGSKLANTFTVNVKEASTSISNAGYSLEADLDTLGDDMANTAAFKAFATPTTSVIEGSGTYELAAFGETNGNPDTAHVNFTGATRVTSSNPIVATALLDDTAGVGVVKVTPLSAGTTTVTVTMKDGSRKSFPITVTATPVQKAIDLNATTVKLSDENRNEAADAAGATFQNGVDGKVVKVTSLDQFNKEINFAAGKVTVSSSTEGLTLYKSDATGTTLGDQLKAGANELDFAGAKTTNFAILAQKDKPVSNATVTVSYFAKATDTKPAVTKTVSVNVTDIDPNTLTSAIDVVAASEIDANYEVSKAPGSIDFSSTPVYALDSKGNRLEKLTGSATIATKSVNDKYVDVTASKLAFKKDNDALTYLRAKDTVDVVVEADGVTKVLPITYKNTAVVPNKAAVSTNAVSVKLKTGVNDIAINDILFGKVDKDQLVKDDFTSAGAFSDIIAVLKTASNGGYLYNKPLVSITGTDGKALATGVNVYGGNADTLDANTFSNSVLEALKGYSTTGLTEDSFEVDYMVANANDASTIAGGIVTPDTGKATTFTLVVKGIYVKDAVLNVEGKALNAASATEKAAHNLLATPVQLNVSVSK
ncbi:S-layer homology domain-containing protein [Priestia koreensis]|uniref:S-layer homology domain-containing protein n=1 Tax=Priestia koreensis TaxID=284581 RepID=UPI003CFF882B